MSGIESADAVVVGAGIVGAACAEALSAAGVRVLVIDRGPPAGAATVSGSGGVLISDKEPGPELELAKVSRRRWPELLAELRELLGPRAAEVGWRAEGGLVVATTAEAVGPLAAMTAAQRAHGVEVEDLDAERARLMEPHLTEALTAAAHFPEDARLEAVPAAAALLAAVRAHGGRVHGGVAAEGIVTDRSGAVAGVRTGVDAIPCRAVVNACGPWAGHFSVIAGAPVDVLPRRDVVLETAPAPGLVGRAVRDAEALDEAARSNGGRVPPGVESAASGAVVIGSDRRSTAFDREPEVEVLRRLARGAIRLFPELAEVPVTRADGGLRPCTPDRLPVIGEDPRLPGLWHASGHGGAEAGLAAATGRLLADLFTGREPVIDPRPFRVDRPESAMEASA